MLAASKFLLSSAANKKNIGCSGVQTEVLKSSWVLSYAGALGVFLFRPIERSTASSLL